MNPLPKLLVTYGLPVNLFSFFNPFSPLCLILADDSFSRLP